MAVAPRGRRGMRVQSSAKAAFTTGCLSLGLGLVPFREAPARCSLLDGRRSISGACGASGRPAAVVARAVSLAAYGGRRALPNS
jgi:hypothetical protein